MKNEIAIGDVASFTKTVTETDVVLFSGITGDFNSYHVDEESSKAGPFGERVAHGLLTSSFICTVLGMRLPGPGTIHLEQTLKFLSPVRIGDTVTASAEVIAVLPRDRIRLRTWCIKQDGTVVIDGEALVCTPAAEAGASARTGHAGP